MSGGLKNAVALCLAIAALYGMRLSTPLYSEIVSPVAVPGVQGKPAKTARFVMGIVKVYLAQELTAPGLGGTRTYTTSGRWLVIEAAAKASSESIALTSAQWRGPDGIRYAMTRRLSATPGLLGSERLEPGIPRPILLVFELPENQIEGGALLVAESALAPLSEQLQITMTPIEAANIHPSITIERGGHILPWKLEFQ